ncbi:MAG: hypothetical protein DMG76_36575 [Acidobacteria bacterium]|nr:MAG: hypothetical protein DMG76_36575 [Acidobacteriota bacterium]
MRCTSTIPFPLLRSCGLHAQSMQDVQCFSFSSQCCFEENPMKAILSGLVALSLLAGMAAAASGPAENDYKAVLTKHWQISKEFTLAVAEAMPAESYDFKPNPDEMSFGQLMIHIALSNSEAFANAAGTEALAQPSGTDKKTAIKFLADSFDRCAKDFEAMTPAQLNRMVDIGAGRQAMAIEVLWWAFTDTAHHRGQAEVYLRVKNIKPPRYVF